MNAFLLAELLRGAGCAATKEGTTLQVQPPSRESSLVSSFVSLSPLRMESFAAPYL